MPYVFQLCNSSSDLTWQRDALYLIRLAGMSLQFTFRHRLRLAQVEKGEPVAHRRLLSFRRRPFAAKHKKTKHAYKSFMLTQTRENW